MGNVVLVIPQKDFRDKELVETKNSLQSKGFKCDIACKSTEKSVGADGLTVNPDITIADAIVGLSMYEAVVFIGGSGARNYFDDKEALGLAKMSVEKGMVTGAICIAPMILAKSGVLEGKRATVWDGDSLQSKYFATNNIEYTGENITVDGKIVTANGPDAASEFGLKIAEVLGKI